MWALGSRQSASLVTSFVVSLKFLSHRGKESGGVRGVKTLSGVDSSQVWIEQKPPGTVLLSHSLKVLGPAFPPLYGSVAWRGE